MIRLQPIAIMLDDIDRYRVRFEGKNGSKEYTFSFDRSPDSSVLVSDQREFYFATYDDIGADCLQQAISSFDRCRTMGSSLDSRLIPVCISVKSPSSTVDGEVYAVQFVGCTGETVYQFAVEGSSVIAPKEYATGVKDESMLKQLYKAILAFYQSRHSEHLPNIGAASFSKM